jgi:prefoldin subunit 5
MMSTEQEISMLQNQAAQLQQTLTALQRPIADLTKAEQNR